MPRFFFDVRDRGHDYRDEDGVDLTDLPEAREQADAIVHAMARDAKPDGERYQWTCEVRDGAGPPVYRARLSIHVERCDLSAG